MSKRLLPLVPPDLGVEQAMPSSERIVIICRSRRSAVVCPDCRQVSTRLHSHYVRRLADLPWQGRQVVIRLVVRRLRCANRRCPRRIFAEPLPAVARRHARRTGRLGDLQAAVSLALGGEAGARLAERLGMPTSPDTLLRLVDRHPGTGLPTPRVLGVDDWAWRRGQRYGTVLVDLERGCVVDLLPDREADTLARWLHAHPGVEIVARDRAGAYATGIRQGAPKAMQVADRWHLLRNGSDALLALVEHRQKLLRDAGQIVVAAHAANTSPEAVPAPVPPNKARRRQAEGRARRQARFEAVADLRRQGLSLRAIRHATGVSRNTLRRWLRAGAAPAWRSGKRGHMADVYADYLRQRWSEGCHNASQLWREAQTQGYPGQVVGLRQWVTQHLRGGPAHPRVAPVAKPVWQVPSPRRASRLLTSEADQILGEDRVFIDELLARSPAIAEAADLTRRFQTMIKEKQIDLFAPWLADAKHSPLASFATSLERDRAAVEAALTTPWSTGPVEGRINKLKLIKRQMYGRAGLNLLRQRVIHG